MTMDVFERLSRELGANKVLRDEERLGGWQSGLMTFDGKRKPSFNAFRRAAGD